MTFPDLGGRLAFGGDYNPEQWPEEVWASDVALMQEAGVTMVTLGVFSWALIEPSEGVYEFGWLDRVLDGLRDGGIAVDLATATASPPAWFTHRYPHTRLVDSAGGVRGIGARQNYCPSAPEYRAAAARLAGEMADRYAAHPAVAMWHVNNEYGCHNWHCFCDVSAAAYRAWLRRRYLTLDALNESWGTAFWSQHYTDWEQVDPPRAVAYNTFANPGQQLDWWRFSSDELRACYQAELDVLRRKVTQPITTNFMSFFKPVDYWSWARHVDFIANDHYLIGEDPEREQHLAMSADLMRSLRGGEPWLIMEHSTSAVNWQPRNIAKVPGELRRNSLQHIARGSDGAMFFQWRASRAGAEKFHSALLPHGGTDSKIWREVVGLGGDLSKLRGLAGSRVEQPRVAIMFGWPSWWSATLDSHPSVDVDPLLEARRWHHALWARNVVTDFVEPGGDLGRYRLVIVPVQYLLATTAASALRDFVQGGGTVVVTYFSGIVDERDHVGLGGYPALLRDVLGLSVEEFFPLPAAGEVGVSGIGPGEVWSEIVKPETAIVVETFTTGPLSGAGAVFRNDFGEGTAWYVATQLTKEGDSMLLDRVLGEAGVSAVIEGLPTGVEATRRESDEGSYLFVINHTEAPVVVEAAGIDLLGGSSGPAHVAPAGGALVIVEGTEAHWQRI